MKEFSSEVMGPKYFCESPSPGLNFVRESVEYLEGAANELVIPKNKTSYDFKEVATPTIDRKEYKNRLKVPGRGEIASPKLRAKAKTKKDLFFHFKLLLKLRSFVTILMEITGRRPAQMLKNEQLNIINDLAWIEQDDLDLIPENNIYLKSRRRKTFRRTVIKLKKKLRYLRNSQPLLKYFVLGVYKSYRKLRFIINKVPIIKPTDKRKIFWDSLVALNFFYNLFIISLTLSFDIKRPEENEDFFNKQSTFNNFITILILICNVFIKLNTSFYHSGDLITKRTKILFNFFRNDSIYDILALLPFIIDWMGIWTKGLSHEDRLILNLPKLLFYLKIFEVSRIINNIQDVLSLGEKAEAILSLLNLITKIFFNAHFFACAWHFIAKYPHEEGRKSWLTSRNLDNMGWSTRYIYSLYFALTTMATVGYGDITPQNELEAVFCVFGMLIGSGVFGYSLNKIGSILDRINRAEREIQSKIKVVNRYMKRKDLDYNLQVKVRKYLMFEGAGEYIECNEDEEKIIDKLPHSLREEVFLESRGVFMKNLPMFVKNFSEDTLRKLVSIMRPINFSPEDIIYQVGDLLDQCIYIVSNGEISLIIDSNKGAGSSSNLKKVQKGDIFGELEFFLDSPRLYTAKANVFSSGYFIRKCEFLNIIKENITDYESFCMIKDNIVLNKNWSSLFTKCFGCHKMSHIFTDCKTLVPFHNKDVITGKLCFSQASIRKNWVRRKRLQARPFNALFRMKEMEKRLEPLLSILRTKNEDEEYPEDWNNSYESSNDNEELEDHRADDSMIRSNNERGNNKKTTEDFTPKSMASQSSKYSKHYSREIHDTSSASSLPKPQYKPVGYSENSIDSSPTKIIVPAIEVFGDSFMNQRSPAFGQTVEPTFNDIENDKVFKKVSTMELRPIKVNNTLIRKESRVKSSVPVQIANSGQNSYVKFNLPNIQENKQKEPEKVDNSHNLSRGKTRQSLNSNINNLELKKLHKDIEDTNSLLTGKTLNQIMNPQHVNKNHEKKNQDGLFLLDMDAARVFFNYFPHNNYEVVVSAAEKIRSQKKFKRKKLTVQTMNSKIKNIFSLKSIKPSKASIKTPVRLRKSYFKE